MTKPPPTIQSLFLHREMELLGFPESILHDSPETSGVVIGACEGKPLIDISMDPIAVLGAARSGKSSCCIIPTLLTWKESAVVVDANGEAYGATENWRRTYAHNKIRCLNFGDPNSPDTFNFLDAIPWEGSDVDHPDHAVWSLAESIIDKALNDSEYRLDDFWHRQSRSLLILLIWDTHIRLKNKACLPDVRQLLVSYTAFSETINSWCNHSAKTARDLFLKKLAESYAKQGEAVKTAVRVMVTNSLAAFGSPEAVQTTSRSTFDVSELLDNEPTTLYLLFKSVAIESVKPLIRIFVDQVVDLRMRSRKHSPHEAPRLLIALDDYSAIDYIGAFEMHILDLQFYGIKPLVALQHLTTQRHINLWQKCATKIVLRIRDTETAFNVAEVGKISELDLIKPQLMAIDDANELVLGASELPILVKKFPYFKDTSYLARSGRQQ